MRSMGLAGYGAASSRTRRLLRWRRRTIRATASIRSFTVRLSRIGSTASRTSAGARPSRTSDAARSLGGAFRPQSEKVDSNFLRALASPQPPQLPHSKLSVAFDLALVDAGDFDLHRQIRAHPLHEGVGGGLSLHERRPIRFRAFADVERAVGLQPGIGGVPVPPEAGGADALRRPAERTRGEVHEVLDDPGQIVMEARRGHQGDEAAHRVEGHPAEMAVPVDGGEGGDGFGVGPKNVEGGAERPLDHGGRSVHGGCASGVNQRAGRREPTAGSVSGAGCGLHHRIPRLLAGTHLPRAGSGEDAAVGE